MMTRTEKFAHVSEKQLEKVGALSAEERKALVRFLQPAAPRGLRQLVNQANNLPERCKKVLEGTLFNEGFIMISLLYGISDLPYAFSKLSSALGLDN